MNQGGYHDDNAGDIRTFVTWEILKVRYIVTSWWCAHPAFTVTVQHGAVAQFFDT